MNTGATTPICTVNQKKPRRTVHSQTLGPADRVRVALIPQDSATGITAGTKVLISVPAARISNVAGAIQEVVPTPVSTSDGIAYQAVVTIDGSAPAIPLDGMAADVRLAS
jgi:ribosomal protein S5